MKAKGVKTPEARFALALQETMNEMGAEGWEYQRAETLPSVERTGLTGSTTNWRHVLVFRRLVEEHVTTLDSAPVMAGFSPDAEDEAVATNAVEEAGTETPTLQGDASELTVSDAQEPVKTPEGSNA